MAIFLDRINSAPLAGNDFPYTFNAWLSNLVDSLNEIIVNIQDTFNTLPASQYTSAQITAMAADLPNGILLYDTTLNEYVGKQNGSLVKFTTSSYP